jgi:hypothetical protein
LFNNGSSGASKVLEFKIDEAAGSATAGATITDGSSSMVLGDVQVLSSGNLWVTYSTSGMMREYDKSGKSIAEYKVGTGYSYFTESLYAVPVNK